MSRRYTQAVEVTEAGVESRAAESSAAEEVAVADGPGRAPGRFLWRGRLYLVRAVLAHWVEVGPWWRDVESTRLRDREVWRVEAAAGRTATVGVYDLCRDGDRWTLTRSYD